MFVDYAGQTVPVVNRDTGELREAQSSSPCSAHRATRSPVHLGPSHYPIGLMHTVVRSLSSAVLQSPEAACRMLGDLLANL